MYKAIKKIFFRIFELMIFVLYLFYGFSTLNLLLSGFKHWDWLRNGVPLITVLLITPFLIYKYIINEEYANIGFWGKIIKVIWITLVVLFAIPILIILYVRYCESIP